MPQIPDLGKRVSRSKMFDFWKGCETGSAKKSFGFGYPYLDRCHRATEQEFSYEISISNKSCYMSVIYVRYERFGFGDSCVFDVTATTATMNPLCVMDGTGVSGRPGIRSRRQVI